MGGIAETCVRERTVVQVGKQRRPKKWNVALNFYYSLADVARQTFRNGEAVFRLQKMRKLQQLS